MTQNTEYPATTPVPPAPRPPLRRSQSDRVLAGVAGGFARWLGIDPVIVRVVLVVLAIFGGSGVLLYLIGWLFIPDDGQPASPAERFIEQSRRPNSTARTVLIVVGVVLAVILFGALVGSVFNGWGGGSVLLLLAAGAAVLYLVNRPPSGTAAYVTGNPVVPATMDVPTGEPSNTAATVVSAPADGPGAASADPTATLPAASPEPPVLPAGFAYGGSGVYPGYVAPPQAVPPVPPKPRSYLGLATLSIAVVVMGILAALDVTGVADVPAVVILAAPLGVLGLCLVVGAFVGRARWLTALAIPLLLVTALVAVIPSNLGARLGSGVGERSWTPFAIESMPAEYKLSIGSAELDLTELALPTDATTIPVRASVGIGELLVTVPEGVRVLVNAQAGLGEVRVEGAGTRSGQNATITTEMPGGPATGPTIDLVVSTAIGDLEVSRA